MEKLLSIFPDTLDYYFEKVREGIGGSQELSRLQWGGKHLQLVHQMLDDFKEKAQERDIPFDPDTTLHAIYQEIKDPLSELEKFFQLSNSHGEESISVGLANALVHFLESKVQELRDIASELDSEQYERTWGE